MDCKQETPFRIGGVYRNKQGDAVMLSLRSAVGRYMDEPGQAFANGADDNRGLGVCVLMTGKNAREPLDLIPGELTQTASGWVALGAEKQEESEWCASCGCGNDKCGYAHLASCPSTKGEPTSADLNVAMILRDGPAKTTPRHLVKAILQDLATPLRVAKPNPFPTTLRSPDCDSGPSDHLSASRHQMAGMKG